MDSTKLSFHKLDTPVKAYSPVHNISSTVAFIWVRNMVCHCECRKQTGHKQNAGEIFGSGTNGGKCIINNFTNDILHLIQLM